MLKFSGCMQVCLEFMMFLVQPIPLYFNLQIGSHNPQNTCKEQKMYLRLYESRNQLYKKLPSPIMHKTGHRMLSSLRA